MPDLRQGSATGKSVEDRSPADALLLFGHEGLGSQEDISRSLSYCPACSLEVTLTIVAADRKNRGARSLSSHSPNKLRQKFSIIQALFAEVYSKKARWWPSGDGMAYVS